MLTLEQKLNWGFFSIIIAKMCVDAITPTWKWAPFLFLFFFPLFPTERREKEGV